MDYASNRTSWVLGLTRILMYSKLVNSGAYRPKHESKFAKSLFSMIKLGKTVLTRLVIKFSQESIQNRFIIIYEFERNNFICVYSFHLIPYLLFFCFCFWFWKIPLLVEVHYSRYMANFRSFKEKIYRVYVYTYHGLHLINPLYGQFIFIPNHVVHYQAW